MGNAPIELSPADYPKNTGGEMSHGIGLVTINGGRPMEYITTRLLTSSGNRHYLLVGSNPTYCAKTYPHDEKYKNTHRQKVISQDDDPTPIAFTRITHTDMKDVGSRSTGRTITIRFYKPVTQAYQYVFDITDIDMEKVNKEKKEITVDKKKIQFLCDDDLLFEDLAELPKKEDTPSPSTSAMDVGDGTAASHTDTPTINFRETLSHEVITRIGEIGEQIMVFKATRGDQDEAHRAKMLERKDKVLREWDAKQQREKNSTTRRRALLKRLDNAEKALSS